MTKSSIPRGKSLREGEAIGARYSIVGWIGEGGMQDVYLARDLSFDRMVALKCPKNSAAEKRFSRSAKIASRINHPNVARTLDYVSADGADYLVEEYISGRDLKQIRTAMPLMDPYAAAHVAHHVAKGLAASHHAGVVHRDLKPSNIMVPTGLDLASVKITDFGIAKMAEAELSQTLDEETITSSSTMAGALPYMAPEMLRGAKYGEKPADVWSIGAMIYEFFSGAKPFGKNFDAVDLIKRAEVPAPPSFAEKPQFSEMAAELYAIIKQCLAKEPADRISADELVRAVSGLCYPLGPRVTGQVMEVRYGTQFFAETDQGKVFFHADSVYGELPSRRDRVSMRVFPGIPFPRAHPVVVGRRAAT